MSKRKSFYILDIFYHLYCSSIRKRIWVSSAFFVNFCTNIFYFICIIIDFLLRKIFNALSSYVKSNKLIRHFDCRYLLIFFHSSIHNGHKRHLYNTVISWKFNRCKSGFRFYCEVLLPLSFAFYFAFSCSSSSSAHIV
jgi:hypothetical protein